MRNSIVVCAADAATASRGGKRHSAPLQERPLHQPALFPISSLSAAIESKNLLNSSITPIRDTPTNFCPVHCPAIPEIKNHHTRQGPSTRFGTCGPSLPLGICGKNSQPLRIPEFTTNPNDQHRISSFRVFFPAPLRALIAFPCKNPYKNLARPRGSLLGLHLMSFLKSPKAASFRTSAETSGRLRSRLPSASAALSIIPETAAPIHSLVQ